MVTALAVLTLVPLLTLWGAVELAGDSPQGLAGVGSACVVLSVGLLVVVRVADEGGPAGLARDRGGTVASGVAAAAGDPVREPVGGRDCAGYLYAVEHAPSDGSSRPGPEWEPLVSGLVASGSLVVETADSRVALPVSRAVEPSFASPAAAGPRGSGPGSGRRPGAVPSAPRDRSRGQLPRPVPADRAGPGRRRGVRPRRPGHAGRDVHGARRGRRADG
ncbi:MAG: hypothetical protein A07HB70_01274 [uncultured archaeon A07HB70]|nr:MAG: hypothetical protein A07HB70_01274 [uncultured archaeon A07HB70]